MYQFVTKLRTVLSIDSDTQLLLSSIRFDFTRTKKLGKPICSPNDPINSDDFYGTNTRIVSQLRTIRIELVITCLGGGKKSTTTIIERHFHPTSLNVTISFSNAKVTLDDGTQLQSPHEEISTFPMDEHGIANSEWIFPLRHFRFRLVCY